MVRSHMLALGLATALLPACSDLDPTGVDPASAEMQASPTGVQAVADLGGQWEWSSVEALRFPQWFAPILGIIAEGENTHARCQSAGTMTLAQTGATFQGTAIKTFNSCETSGGQVFVQPEINRTVEAGRISGHSIHFSFNSATVRPCPHQAVISELEGGLATALDGGGRCNLPGHPQSESPIAIDPPPGGTATTLSWRAWRP